jgi:hypothetical protein
LIGTKPNSRLKYRMYATTVLLFVNLHKHIFDRNCIIWRDSNKAPQILVWFLKSYRDKFIRYGDNRDATETKSRLRNGNISHHGNSPVVQFNRWLLTYNYFRSVILWHEIFRIERLNILE